MLPRRSYLGQQSSTKYTFNSALNIRCSYTADTAVKLGITLTNCRSTDSVDTINDNKNPTVHKSMQMEQMYKVTFKSGYWYVDR